MKVGFVGLGHMGGAMSRNILAAGHQLVVHDLRAEAAAGLLADGAAWAASPRDAAAGQQVAITMLPGPPQVERVLLGPDGLLAGLAPGAIWMDMSTSVPAVASRVRAAAGPRGVAVLDAPVSGMASGARAGTLQIFVGGDRQPFLDVLPLLTAMGDAERILHVGEHDVLSVLQHGDYDESFTLALACKDLGLAVDLARETGVPGRGQRAGRADIPARQGAVRRQRRGDAPDQAARRPQPDQAAPDYPPGLTIPPPPDRPASGHDQPAPGARPCCQPLPPPRSSSARRPRISVPEPSGNSRPSSAGPAAR